MPSSFNIAPQPQAGAGAFGAVPGNLSNPNSTFQQLQQIPGFSGLSTSAIGDTQSQLNSSLSPQTQNLLQNKAASLGVSMGQPGGGTASTGNTFTTQNLLDNLGITSEQLQNQGLSNFNTLSSTTGQQQLSPELQSSIQEQNAVNAATPNPAAAQSEALSLYQQYMALANPQNQNQTQFQKASAAGGGDAFLPAGSTDWRPGSGFSPQT
jgi:hypothetical protein